MRLFLLLALSLAATWAADSATAAGSATSAGLPTLLELGSKKCIPCKKMAPILEALGKDFAGRLAITSIDVNADEAGRKAALDWKIELIPTQIFLDAAGKELFRHQGFFDRDEILARWRLLGVDLGDPKP